MTKTKWALTFIWKLSLILLIALSLQMFVYHFLELKQSFCLTGLSYLFNFFLTLLTVFILVRFQDRHTESLGYIFLGLSVIKLLSFYFGIYPLLIDYYSEQSKKLAFLVFFIPYTIALTMEIRVLTKRLNLE